MTLLGSGTILVISSPAGGLPLYSARGLKQVFYFIDQAKVLERTVNGEMIDLGEEQFKLYGTKISAVDQNVPAFDNIFPGDVVTIDSVAELAYATGSSGSPGRTAVASRVVGSTTFYRPRLLCKFMDMTTYEWDEWGRAISWEADFQESI